MKLLFGFLITFINYATGDNTAVRFGSPIFSRRVDDGKLFHENTNKKHQSNANIGHKENSFSYALNSENRNPNINTNSEYYNNNNDKNSNKVPPSYSNIADKQRTSENIPIKNHLQTTHFADNRKLFFGNRNRLHITENIVKTNHPTRKPLTENLVQTTENVVKTQHLQPANVDKQQTKVSSVKKPMSENDEKRQHAKPTNAVNNRSAFVEHSAKHQTNGSKSKTNSHISENRFNKKLQHKNIESKNTTQLDNAIIQTNNAGKKHLKVVLKRNSKIEDFNNRSKNNNNTNIRNLSLRSHAQIKQLQHVNTKVSNKTQQINDNKNTKKHFEQNKTSNIGNKRLQQLKKDNKRFQTVQAIYYKEAKHLNNEQIPLTPPNLMEINSPLVNKVSIPTTPSTNPSQLIVNQRKKQPYTPKNNFEASIIDAKDHLAKQKMKSRSPFKVMQFQKEGLFLDFENIPTDEKMNRHNHKCKHYELNELKLLKIKNEHGRVNTFYVFPRPISGGASSKVFHASPIDAVDMDGKQITKCVAIKSVILEFPKASPEVIQGFAKEEHFLMMFRNNPNIKHIVHLHYMKRDYEKNRLIIILELGKHDLTKRMQLMRNQWRLYWGTTTVNIDDQIKKLLRQVLEAVHEMHGKAIHLDFKSDNLLFVENTDDTTGRKVDEVLKVIDFGSSEIIEPSMDAKSHEASEVANVCRLRKGMWSDDRYSSPEQNIACSGSSTDVLRYTVSTKADIWSIGIMLIEFLLLTPHFPEIEPIVIRGSSDVYNIYNVVIKLNHWHYSLSPILNASSKLSMDYLAKIHDIFPFFYTIIKACLQVDPRQRPTAKGILDFLDGKCQLNVLSTRNSAQNDMGQNGQYIGRKKRSTSAPFAERKFHRFSHELLESPLNYCDIGNFSKKQN